MGQVHDFLCPKAPPILSVPKLDGQKERTRALRAEPLSLGQSVGRSDRLSKYQILYEVGSGAFGRVFCLQRNGQKFALKKIKKSALIKDQIDMEYIITEKNVMKHADSPFVVRLHESFQDAYNAYLVMDFCAGGDLYQLLRIKSKLDEHTTRFFMMQIFLGINYLHEIGVVYRDLKTENVLLTEEGNLKLADFGLAKVGIDKANTRCGTLIYMAPEVLAGKSYNHTIDYWGLGCLIFEMLHGKNPFEFNNETQAKMKILKGESYPISPQISSEAKDLIKGLLTVDPNERLGSKGSNQIMQHPFFHNIEWKDIKEFRIAPPFKPDIKNKEMENAQLILKKICKDKEQATFLKIPNFTEDAENDKRRKTLDF